VGKLSTMNKYMWGAKINDMLIQNVAISLQSKLNNNIHVVTGGLHYLEKKNVINLTLNYESNDGEIDYLVNGNGVLNWSNVYFGSDMLYSKEKGLTKWGVKLEYRPNDKTIVSLYSLNKNLDDELDSRYGIGMLHKIRDNITGAMDFRIGKNSPRLRVGYDYQLDDSFSIKTRTVIAGEEKMRVGIALKHSINKTLTLIISGDINTKKIFGGISGDDDNHRFGLGLNIFD